MTGQKRSDMKSKMQPTELHYVTIYTVCVIIFQNILMVCCCRKMRQCEYKCCVYCFQLFTISLSQIHEKGIAIHCCRRRLLSDTTTRSRQFQKMSNSAHRGFKNDPFIEKSAFSNLLKKKYVSL